MASPAVKLGSEALIPPCPGCFLLSYRLGWFVCGGFASCLAPLTRLAVPLTPPLSCPRQRRAMVPTQHGVVSGPQVSPRGWAAFGQSTAPVLLQVTSWPEPAPGCSLLAPIEGDCPPLHQKPWSLFRLGCGMPPAPGAGSLSTHGRALCPPPGHEMHPHSLMAMPPFPGHGELRARTACTRSIRQGNWALPCILISIRGPLTRGTG